MPDGIPFGELIVREIVPLQTDFTDEITKRLEALTVRAMDQAEQFLEYGTTEQRLNVMRILLSGALKAVGSDAGQVEKEARISLENVWEAMRTIPNAPAPTPIAAATHHPDKIPND